VAATTAVVLGKHRQRCHVIELYFRLDDTSQVAMFEISRARAAPVVAVLNARVLHVLRLGRGGDWHWRQIEN
jgi:hypothetical protein